MGKHNTYYLVGNAHLDPVWQWRWQEGSMEAKATIRSALDRMNEFPDFRFVCSSASVYQWVEAFDPDMLEEVKARVKEGRFIIVGGWHVQPDCNLPSGEAFARQSLYAQRYFLDTFGVTAKVGYNVDSFGHNAMMPQILRKSGMDSYIFMRPSQEESPRDNDLFQWISPDGSSVTTYRIPDTYGFRIHTEEDLLNRLETLEETAQNDLDFVPFFYGVGNHGGGPTIRNLQLLEAYKKAHPEKKLIDSDISDFFDAARKAGALPEYRGDLQHHASGCYAAEPTIKTGIRRAENELLAAENYAMLAAALLDRPVKTAHFAESWREVCFCHFHDSMDGCSIKAVYDDAALMLGAARRRAAVEENNALQSISWKIDTHDKTLGQPVVVFNPHGFPVRRAVQLNNQFGRIVDHTGKVVPSQQVWSPTHGCYWRNDTVFQAEVPALGYAVYYMADQDGKPWTPEQPSAVRAVAWDGPMTANEYGGTILENDRLSIRFEQYSGYIASMVDKITGRELLTGKAAVPLVIDEYYHDAWSHAKNFFTDVMARFSDAQVTVVENGPVRATVKVVSRYNASVLTQYFTLCAGDSKLHVKANLQWHEKHKMLKLAWPMAVEDPKAYYEIPYGVIERPADGEEEPGICWTAVKGSNGGFAIVNDNTYSSSVQGGTLLHTVIRSPIYGDHGGPRTAESDYTAQGSFDFAYTLMQTTENWWDLIREGRVLNQPLTNIMETWHPGTLTDAPLKGLSISVDNVQLSAIKRSEDGNGTVLRVYETEGRETDFAVYGTVLSHELRAHITPWSVQTWFCRDGEGTWREVLLTELDM